MIEQLISAGIISSTGYALMGLSLGMMYRLNHELHLELGGMFLIGGYTFVWLPQATRVVWLLSLLLGLLAVITCSAVLEVLLMRPLRRKASSEVILIVNLGLLVCFQSLCALIFGPNPKSLPWSVESASIAGVFVTKPQVVTVIATVLLFAATIWTFYRTSFGASWRATANDPELATCMGIRTDNVQMFTLLGCSSVAYIAGILLTADTAIQPMAGFSIVLLGFIAMFVGGVYHPVGILLGALFIALIQNLGIYWISSLWKDAIAFVVLILFLLVRPQGIAGTQSHRTKV